MENKKSAGSALVHAYEAGFSVVMAALAFLCRDNARLDYPEIAYLFLLVLGLNLFAGAALRRWPENKAVAAFLVVANLAAITGIVVHSGGRDSNLWVLYLLPVYSVCMLLEGREVFWVAAGVAALNTMPALLEPAWGQAEVFALALKNGILIFAVAATNRIAQQDRAARQSLEAKRRVVLGLEDALEGLGRKLKRTERLAEAGLMASGIAHDLRNVLAVILGYVSVLRGYKISAPEAAHDLDTIQRSVDLGQRILENYRRSVLRQEPPLAPCSLNDILLSVAEMSERDLRRCGIRLSLELDRSLPSIVGDPVGLERVLLNLASNAAKAVPGGGVLTMRTEAAEGLDGATAIRVVVEDTGPGIPPEILPRLFKPFASTRQAVGGTGLGLYLGQAIAQQHGGMLSAENREEGGARFTLTLPLPSAAAGEKLADGLAQVL